MVTRSLATSVSKQAKEQTQTRTATVLDVLAPTADEADVVTGWQVLLDFGGNEVRRAGVASSYNPVPGDVVAVARYLNTLFVIDKVVAGNSGDAPTNRVAYSYVKTPGTYATAAASAEIQLSTDLTLTVPMRNGAAYNVRLRTGYTGATANTWAFFRLRQDTAAGADIGEYFRAPVTLVTATYGFDNTLVLRNDTGLDLNVVIMPTLTAPATGSASAFCTAQSRAYIEVTVIGSSKLYPYAAAIVAPAGLT